MSATGDEAKVNMLMVGNQPHVYRGAVAGGAGVVYIVLTPSPLVCRVGAFDAAHAHGEALLRLVDPASGWLPELTTSTTPAAGMQIFRKDLGEARATVNISWPAGPQAGPNGLTAMATMVVDSAR